jgi:hypothetical protein
LTGDRWRLNKATGRRGEQREEACQRSAVEVEARILQSAKGQEINEADTLQEVSVNLSS